MKRIQTHIQVLDYKSKLESLTCNKENELGILSTNDEFLYFPTSDGEFSENLKILPSFNLGDLYTLAKILEKIKRNTVISQLLTNLLTKIWSTIYRPARRKILFTFVLYVGRP
jgi:hypothetical protein